MSNVTEISSTEQFDAALSEGDAVVKFWATWCGPCRRFAPHFEKASELVGNKKFLSVDVDSTPDLAKRYGIMKVPTVLSISAGGEKTLDGRTVVQLMNELA